MAINISTVTNKLAPVVGPGSQINDTLVSGVLESYQAAYAFSRSSVYAEFRDKALTGYHYGNAPWYVRERDVDANWIGHLCRVVYERPPIFPNSDLSAVAVAPTVNTPVGTGVPGLRLVVEGVNLEWFFQIEAIKIGLGPPSNDGYGIDYTGNTSKQYGTVAGTYNSISPWLSTYATFDNTIGFPVHGIPDDRYFTLDFYYRAANVSGIPGYLSKLAIIEPQFSDFPAGSY
jgi:hypothetical protein